MSVTCHVVPGFKRVSVRLPAHPEFVDLAAFLITVLDDSSVSERLHNIPGIEFLILEV